VCHFLTAWAFQRQIHLLATHSRFFAGEVALFFSYYFFIAGTRTRARAHTHTHTHTHKQTPWHTYTHSHTRGNGEWSLANYLSHVMWHKSCK
jgi:hypothetical protein